MTDYTQQDFAAATEITSTQYLKLLDPKFEGQTRMDQDGNYSMYFSCNGVLYMIRRSLLN